MQKNLIALFCAASVMAPRALAAQALYIGDTATFAFGFCPVGWAAANGQLMAIADHDALFQLIGTTYGGDGQTTFALPKAKEVVTLETGATLTQCVSLFGIFPSRN